MIKSNDIVLKTASAFIFWIILFFSFYVLFTGHNAPGGGFIGGLMTASALLLATIAFNIETMQRRLPLNYTYVTAAGLFIAITTGIGSFIFNVPFLTHSPGFMGVSTATLFDLGVYFTVVGVTMTILLTIGGDRGWKH